MKHLSVSVTNGDFTNIPYDQRQEDNIKEIKAPSGFTKLINKKDQNFLKNLKICFPKLNSTLIKWSRKKIYHKKDKNVYSSYIGLQKVFATLNINPFIVSELQTLDSSYSFSDFITAESNTET